MCLPTTDEQDSEVYITSILDCVSIFIQTSMVRGGSMLLQRNFCREVVIQFIPEEICQRSLNCKKKIKKILAYIFSLSIFFITLFGDLFEKFARSRAPVINVDGVSARDLLVIV